jgi:hypothetical protein
MLLLSWEVVIRLVVDSSSKKLSLRGQFHEKVGEMRV